MVFIECARSGGVYLVLLTWVLWSLSLGIPSTSPIIPTVNIYLFLLCLRRDRRIVGTIVNKLRNLLNKFHWPKIILRLFTHNGVNYGFQKIRTTFKLKDRWVFIYRSEWGPVLTSTVWLSVCLSKPWLINDQCQDPAQTFSLTSLVLTTYSKILKAYRKKSH